MSLRMQLDTGRLFFRSFILVAYLLSELRLAHAQTFPPSLQADFDKGVAAVQSGHAAEAEQWFLRVLRKGGKASFVYNNLGIVYQLRGDQARAIALFREAIRLQPNYAAARILLGASLLAGGRDAQAVQELEHAVNIAPDQLLARIELAKAYSRIGNYAGALGQYWLLHSLEPNNPEFLYQLGRAYSDQAQWSLEQIRKINPGSACLYETLAEDYRLQGHLDLAVSAYQRALSVEPKRPGIHLALAQVYVHQGRIRAALKEINDELAIVPESIKAKELAKEIKSRGGN